MFLLIGLQSTLRPPNRNKQLSGTAVSVCHDLPTGVADSGTLEKIFCTVLLKTNMIKEYAILNINANAKNAI